VRAGATDVSLAAEAVRTSLRSGAGGTSVAHRDCDRDAARRLWRDMARMRALHEDRVQAADADLVNRQGPCVIEGRYAVCRALAAAQPAR
jgi:hypothetical protein